MARKNPPPTDEAERVRWQRKQEAFARLEAASASNKPVKHDVLVLSGNAALLDVEGEREILKTTRSGKHMSASVPVRLVIVGSGGEWVLAEATIGNRQLPPHIVEMERNGKTRLNIHIDMAELNADDIDLVLYDQTLKLVDADEILTPDPPDEPSERFDSALEENDLRAASEALRVMSVDDLMDLAESFDIPMGDSPRASTLQKKILRLNFPCSRCGATGKVEQGGEEVPCRKCEGTGCHAVRHISRPQPASSPLQPSVLDVVAAQPSMPAHVAAQLAAVLGTQAAIRPPVTQPPPAAQPAQPSPAATGPGRPAGSPDMRVIVAEVRHATHGAILSGEMGMLNLAITPEGHAQAALLVNGRLYTTNTVTKSNTDPEELRLAFNPPQGGWAEASVHLTTGKTTRMNLPVH